MGFLGNNIWNYGLKLYCTFINHCGYICTYSICRAFATIPVVVVALLQFGIGFDFYMIVGLYLLFALDGNLLVPILFSDAVKLHPVVIMLAVFVFGGIFGFWGAFFSIPLATFIKAIWNSWPSPAPVNEV